MRGLRQVRARLDPAVPFAPMKRFPDEGIETLAGGSFPPSEGCPDEEVPR